MAAPEDSLTLSHFLTLPRELRDAVLENLLVLDTIPLECAITSIPRFKHQVDPTGEHFEVFQEQELEKEYPLRVPCTRRTTWIVPLKDVVPTDYWGNLYSEDWELIPETVAHEMRVGMTYQRAPRRASPEFGVMRVCKQLFHEGSEIFWGKNIFSFTDDFRIPTAVHFLRDRPPATLSQITSIEIALTEDGFVDVSTGPLLSQYPPQESNLEFGYELYPQLCALAASPAMRLRHLILGVETLIERRGQPGGQPGGQLVSITKCLRDEEAGHLTIPTWLDPLLSISGLESVSVRWFSSIPIFQRTGRCLDQIRCQMLQDRPLEGKIGTATERRNIGFYARAIQQTDENRDDYEFVTDVRATLEYNTETGQLQQRDCALEFEGNVLVEVPKEETNEVTEWANWKARPGILKGWEGLNVFITHCQLRRN
ncbi:hypothetical protein K458DRAFT_416853 [Lentithecium fluviatile CBS 122367]|uniref:Uncharacterized protein n=1 Tax=Lentithecium fluviatile CBS 122367 TaxID=1168545 RepID=A0A6G1J5D6_9PLEO|nr:hypothetical protein K458DRAFT_416853 [Lentithecium fluviatile CBS 122367]